jgi:cytochrome c556
VKQFILAAAAVAAIVTGAAAQYRAAAPADVIRMRQANYKQIGAAMKGINEELRGSAPSLPAIRARSRIILGFAPQVLRWFPPGTGLEAGIRTRARPEIWTDRAGFRRAGAGLLVAARAFDAAARRDDLDAIRDAASRLGHACSACHDDYRAPEH